MYNFTLSDLDRRYLVLEIQSLSLAPDPHLISSPSFPTPIYPYHLFHTVELLLAVCTDLHIQIWLLGLDLV